MILCFTLMGNACTIQGYNEVEEGVTKVRIHKKTYCIFEVSQVDPVALKVVTTGGLDTSVDLRNTPTEEQLKTTFNECSSKIDSNKPCFIVYNFGYINEKNNYREMVLFISFIPENANLRLKIAMASNTSVLQGYLQTPMHIEIHDLEDFNLNYLKKECSYIQRK